MGWDTRIVQISGLEYRVCEVLIGGWEHINTVVQINGFGRMCRTGQWVGDMCSTDQWAGTHVQYRSVGWDVCIVEISGLVLSLLLVLMCC